MLHFVTGPQYNGPFTRFVNGYLIDIFLPFALYFLLIPNEEKFPVLRHWYIKSMLPLFIGVSVELMQLAGYNFFGETFDPLDFAAYFSGVLLAAVFDCLIFPCLFSFWKTSFPQN